ncbi:hypothetical protein TIFTF001_021773 [Ficus carica]|uniref:Uncharacterized protein n=1 Tax=Ficus carica TaxID=3494 RepID=A0AA88DEX9_FICCA|nr:hypothetical protein TIFTF001_021773 [Ficus carica]
MPPWRWEVGSMSTWDVIKQLREAFARGCGGVTGLALYQQIWIHHRIYGQVITDLVVHHRALWGPIKVWVFPQHLPRVVLW